ncbi:hypothetical protein D9M70_546700 [compost metagenome]
MINCPECFSIASASMLRPSSSVVRAAPTMASVTKRISIFEAHVGSQTSARNTMKP